MRSKYLFIIIIVLSFNPETQIFSQVKIQSGDKYNLLTKSYNLRPLNIYKGQLQLNAGYKFGIISRIYTSNGNKTVLKDIGTASVAHNYFFDIKYGITDFLELNAETNFLKSGFRSESVVYFSSNTSGGTDVVSVNRLDEIKGFSDLFLGGSFRLPIEFKVFDFRVRGGYYLPTSRYKPPAPTSKVVDFFSSNPNTSYTINYHYNNKNGYGVPVLLLSAAAKLTFSKISFEADMTLRDPVKEGKNIRWQQSKAGQEFTYYSNSYGYLLDRTMVINTSMHYQAAGWFNIWLNGSFYSTSKGWTEYYGSKYSNPEQKLFSLEPGFEIQVTPLMVIIQNAGFPISGESTKAPFYIFTTVRFNFFPF